MRQQGFSLLEVMLALALVAGTLGVVAHLLLVATRARGTAREITLSTALAAQKIEQVRALAFGLRFDGSVVHDASSDLGGWPETRSGGHGLSASPSGTLDTNTAGFVDYLDASGRWVGSGTSPPGTARFARRWSIEPADGSTPSALRVRVLVCRKVPGWAITAAAGPPWLPVVQLESVRARRAE